MKSVSFSVPPVQHKRTSLWNQKFFENQLTIQQEQIIFIWLRVDSFENRLLRQKKLTVPENSASASL